MPEAQAVKDFFQPIEMCCDASDEAMLSKSILRSQNRILDWPFLFSKNTVKGFFPVKPDTLRWAILDEGNPELQDISIYDHSESGKRQSPKATMPNGKNGKQHNQHRQEYERPKVMYSSKELLNSSPQLALYDTLDRKFPKNEDSINSDGHEIHEQPLDLSKPSLKGFNYATKKQNFILNQRSLHPVPEYVQKPPNLHYRQESHINGLRISENGPSESWADTQKHPLDLRKQSRRKFSLPPLNSLENYLKVRCNKSLKLVGDERIKIWLNGPGQCIENDKLQTNPPDDENKNYEYSRHEIESFNQNKPSWGNSTQNEECLKKSFQTGQILENFSRNRLIENSGQDDEEFENSSLDDQNYEKNNQNYGKNRGTSSQSGQSTIPNENKETDEQRRHRLEIEYGEKYLRYGTIPESIFETPPNSEGRYTPPSSWYNDGWTNYNDSQGSERDSDSESIPDEPIDPVDNQDDERMLNYSQTSFHHTDYGNLEKFDDSKEPPLKKIRTNPQIQNIKKRLF